MDGVAEAETPGGRGDRVAVAEGEAVDEDERVADMVSVNVGTEEPLGDTVLVREAVAVDETDAVGVVDLVVVDDAESVALALRLG